MLFSIVVPVYNAQKYLENTVESVRQQSFRDWELILVDDGSTDDSLRVCRSLEALDTRIHVLTQPNGGPSAARNTGTAAAQGEYVLFLDSDDEYLPGALAAVAEMTEATGADVVVSAMQILRRDSREIVSKMDFDLGGSRFTREELCRAMREKRLAPGPCRYAVKLQMLRENSVRFPEKISIAEDCLWLCTMLEYVKTAAFNSAPFYQYNVHSGSITTTMSYVRMKDLMTVCERLFVMGKAGSGELQALRFNYCCILTNSMLQHFAGQSAEHRRSIRAWVRQHDREFSEALHQQPLIRLASFFLGNFRAMRLFAQAVRWKGKLSGR
ncbi:MAG: glycosyltransferase family 2 protein [Oscillospiraceae bacterium]|nr:glycosyltransferase family 2 protein [Oscillospiraceae bacterium]